MPTLEEAKSAYDKAIAAGDTSSAKEIASFINKNVPAQDVKQTSKFVPEMVPQASVDLKSLDWENPESAIGNYLVAKQKSAEISARNLQGQLGLQEPVSSTDTVSLKDRMISAWAPEGQKTAYYESQYGKGSYIPVSSKSALVKVPDGKNGFKWVVDNPNGLDAGDLVEMGAKSPEFLANVGTQIATAPLTASTGGFSLPIQQAAGSTAQNVVGAGTDIAYRALSGLPVDPSEIAQRRAKQIAIDTAVGTFLGKGTEFGVNKAAASRMSTQLFNSIQKEGVEAKGALQEFLSGSGRSVENPVKLGDALRSINTPENQTASTVGDSLAEHLTQQDNALRQRSAAAASKAASALQKNAGQAISESTSGNVLSPVDAGNAAIEASQQLFNSSKQATELLFNTATNTINQDALGRGVSSSFVKLENTDRILNSIALPVNASGEIATAFSPLRATVNSLKDISSTPQRLDAARLIRSQLGAKIGSASNEILPGLDIGTAKQLYKSLSQDIDNSIASFSGKGADQLRAANTAYKTLLEPMESSPFAYKLLNNGFSNPEDVISHLTNAGSEDWKMAQQILPANTFANVRRTVVDNLMGTGKVSVGGTDFADLTSLSNTLSKIQPEVKNIMFGSGQSWKMIEDYGAKMQTLKGLDGIFTSPTLPSVQELKQAADVANRSGSFEGQDYLKQAIKLADQRRINMSDSLASQVLNGNSDFVSKNPDHFVDSFLFGTDNRPEYIRKVFNKLPSNVQQQVSDIAYERLWARARNDAASTISGEVNTYNPQKIYQDLMGSKEQQAKMLSILGSERNQNIQNWVKYEVSRNLLAKKEEVGAKAIQKVISVLPYKNLFQAKLAATAINGAAGQNLISGSTAADVALFSKARIMSMYPKQTALSSAVIQQALDKGSGYDNYQEMMHNYNHDQQQAIDDYLLNR
jgi:hypothetical protein